MSTGHTPGPWEVGQNSQKTWVQGVGNLVGCHLRNCDRKHRNNNARLIAAAPELLAALLAMIEGDKEAIADADRFGIPFPDELLTSYHQACAAIHKATGEKA